MESLKDNGIEHERHQTFSEDSECVHHLTNTDITNQTEASADESNGSTMVQPVMITVSTQTDDYDVEEEEDDEAYYIDLESADMLPEIYRERHTSKDVLLACDDVDLNSAGTDLGIAPDFDDDLGRTVDFEYEEVTIFRTDFDQKIGLTLCYGSAHDEITDIFVNEVDPQSVAGADGRVKEGDQILQINGFDVHTRQQAVRMFAESGATITLLLARPTTQLFQIPDDHRDQLSRNDLGKSSEIGQNDGLYYGNGDALQFPRSSNDGQSLQLGTVNQSSEASFEKTAAKTTITDDLESQIAVLNEEMKRIRLQYQDFLASQQKEQCLPEIADVTRSPRMVPRMGTRLDPIRQLHTSTELAEASRAHGEQVAFDHLSRIYENEPFGRKRSPKRSHQRRANSAEDSCRGKSPLVVERQEEFNALHRLVSKPSHSDLEQQTSGGYVDGAQKEWSSDGDGRVVNPVGSGAHVAEVPQKGDAESLQKLYNQYIEVMYTNKANLQHTIMVQQNLFHQQWLAKQNLLKFKAADDEASGQVKSRFHPSSHSNSSDAAGMAASALPEPEPRCQSRVPPVTVATGSDVQMEWVVKRRSDGSRYITRRPVRSRILKERARKLAEERCGLTTDDDAISELKVGRYWSKEERKRHLEKARNHRRQKEMLLKQQMESAKENQEIRKEGFLLELSQRRTARSRDKKASEGVSSALVEADSHKSRDAHGKAYNPLFSVTTV